MAYSQCSTKAARISYVRAKVATDINWALKGLQAIYKYQTAAEQSMQDTSESNGVGFNGVDGHLLSSFAEQVLGGRTLTVKQVAILYKKMPKYARQLVVIASNKE